MYYQYNDQSGAQNATLTVNVNNIKDKSRSRDNPFRASHCISIDPGCATSGTITVTSKALGGLSGETVFDADGAPLIINLADSGEPLTRKLTNFPVESFTFAGSGMNGNENWTVTIVSGD